MTNRKKVTINCTTTEVFYCTIVASDKPSEKAVLQLVPTTLSVKPD